VRGVRDQRLELRARDPEVPRAAKVEALLALTTERDQDRVDDGFDGFPESTRLFLSGRKALSLKSLI